MEDKSVSNEENDILIQLQKISYQIVKKEQVLANIYHVEIPEEVIKHVFDLMFSINQSISEFRFMKNMRNEIFKDVITKIGINDILREIETLVEYVEENYYYEIATNVKIFLDEVIKSDFILNSHPDYNMYITKIHFYAYKIEVGYNANIRVKKHPEYAQIKDLIEHRENIIKFFHNKIKVEDYILEELDELKNLLLEYEKHMGDVDKVKDRKLKGILFQNFYSNYKKRLDLLFLINDI